MAQKESCSDEDVRLGGKDEYSEEDKGCNEFVETLELIGASAKELNVEVSDSISEVSNLYKF